jgi:hypothetical protein
VCKSPLVAIAEYEREHGLPHNYINCSMYVLHLCAMKLTCSCSWCSVARGRCGAWQRFERGEVQLYAFYEAFGRELSDVDNGNEWYRRYCARRNLRGLSLADTPAQRALKRRTLACPELPGSLNIDGREVGRSGLAYGLSVTDSGYKLFGRMMRGSHEYDAVVVEAIRRIRGTPPTLAWPSHD